MDQFFTTHETALQTWNILQQFLSTYPIKYHYVEPCAGNGSYYYLLPHDQRTAFELDETLCQKNKDYIHQDFLTVEHIDAKLPIVFIGNPPFSLNTCGNKTRKKNIQLLFIQKCEKLKCEVIAFILGANMHRLKPTNPVKHMILAHSTFLPQTIFHTRSKQIKKYNVYFDIYIRGEPLYPTLTVLNHPSWEFVFPKPENKIDLCFIRWGSNIGKIVDISTIIKTEYEKCKRFKYVSSFRFFFISFHGCTLQDWIPFLQFITEYVNTISTITLSSVSCFEVVYLWNVFASSKKRKKRKAIT